MPPQAALLPAPPKAPPGAGFPAAVAGPRASSSWLLMPTFRRIAWGGVLLRTMHVLALFYHPMASNHPGIIRVMQPYNSPAALSFA